MKPISSPPLRLFALRDATTGHTIPNLFFADKQMAKIARDKGGSNLRVTLGPDHRRYKK